MTTITVEVPNHLATKIDSIRDRLPDLLSEALMFVGFGQWNQDHPVNAASGVRVDA